MGLCRVSVFLKIALYGEEESMRILTVHYCCPLLRYYGNYLLTVGNEMERHQKNKSPSRQIILSKKYGDEGGGEMISFEMINDFKPIFIIVYTKYGFIGKCGFIIIWQ